MDDLSTSSDIVGGSIDVALTVVGDAALPARRVVRRRLSFPQSPDDGLNVADYSDLFAPGTTLAPWNVQRWRYLVVNSVAEAGLLQAEVAAYTAPGAAQPARVVVRINQPSWVWEPSTAYAVGALVVPSSNNGFGYECTQLGTSGAAPPTFPVSTGATVTDGSVVWTCLGPSTPAWTMKVVELDSVTELQIAGGITQIFTSASATVPAGIVIVTPGQITWTAQGATGITAGFDIAELQSTGCAVDATHPNHLVFTTVTGSVWQADTVYGAGALVRPPPPDNGYYYACTTPGTSGPLVPSFPATAGATVRDGTASWTCVGLSALRTVVFDVTFDANTGSWTRTLTISDSEADSRVLCASTVAPVTGTPTLSAVTGWQSGSGYSTGAVIAAAPANGYGYACTTAGTSGASPPSFPTATGSTLTDGTVVWTCLGLLVAPATQLTDGTTYYNASFLSPVGAWRGSTAFAVDALIHATPANGNGYTCTTAGTSAVSAPTFPTSPGATVTDGTVVWTCLGPDPTTSSSTATGNRGYSDRLYSLLPEIDRYYDEPTPNLAGIGQLRRFLQTFGPGLDEARSLADGLLSLHDVQHVDAAYLPRLARWIGWDPDLTQPEPLQRNDILFAPQIFASVGTIPTTAALVNRMSGWPCQIKEMLDNVFLTNGVEPVRLWQVFEATSTAGPSGLSVPAPQASVYPLSGEPAVSQQDPKAFDARPAAVIDTGGTIWLAWHSHRLGSEWQGSTAYTMGSIVAPYAANGYQYQCVKAGTSGSLEPTFPPLAGAQVTDGTAVWTCAGSIEARRRIWMQRLTVDPTPFDVVGDLPDEATFFDEAPSLFFDGTNVWVFWSSNRSGAVDIWARSVTAGSPPTLNPPAQLTEEGVGDRNPAAVRDSTGKLWVFWESSRRGPTDIWAVTSTNDGVSWSPALRITTGNQRDRTPCAVVDSSSALRLFYSEETGDGCKIREGVLSGTSTWTFSDVTTSIPSFRDESPTAVVSGSTIWVFWHSNRFGSIWQPFTAYAVGALVLPPTSNGSYYQCVKAGTSAAAAPTFLTTPGATVTDGSVGWSCVGPVASAGMLQRFRIWSATSTATGFTAPAATVTRLSNDQQPAALIDHSSELHLYFASQQTGARFVSRTVDTSTTPATGRTQIANELALKSMRTFVDRMHCTYDTSVTTNATTVPGRPVVYARDTVAIFLQPTAGPSDPQNLVTAGRVRALVAQFQPIQVKLVWYVEQSSGAYATPYADAVHSLQTQGQGT